MKSTVGTILVASAVLLCGCGKEQGRLPFAGEASATGTFALEAGEVAFWTDIDIDYQGSAALAYEVELSQGGKLVAKATCDPLGRLPMKTSWVETNINDSHRRSGNGKMTCSATLTKAGPTTIKAKLAFSRKPTSGGIKKADLVLKQ